MRRLLAIVRARVGVAAGKYRVRVIPYPDEQGPRRCWQGSRVGADQVERVRLEVVRRHDLLARGLAGTGVRGLAGRRRTALLIGDALGHRRRLETR